MAVRMSLCNRCHHWHGSDAAYLAAVDTLNLCQRNNFVVCAPNRDTANRGRPADPSKAGIGHRLQKVPLPAPESRSRDLELPGGFTEIPLSNTEIGRQEGAAVALVSSLVALVIGLRP